MGIFALPCFIHVGELTVFVTCFYLNGLWDLLIWGGSGRMRRRRSVVLFSDPGGLGAHSADSSLRKDHGEEAKTLRG